MARKNQGTDRTTPPWTTGAAKDVDPDAPTPNPSSSLSDWVYTLRVVHKLTPEIDYGFCVKYNEVHVLCNQIHETVIVDCAERYGLKLASIHPFLYDGQKAR